MQQLIERILILIIIVILIVLIYATDYYEENRINDIESRLNEQMNYIHNLEADVDNLYEVEEE